MKQTNEDRAEQIVSHINGDIGINPARRLYSHAVRHISDLLDEAEYRGMKKAGELCLEFGRELEKDETETREDHELKMSAVAAVFNCYAIIKKEEWTE